MSSQRDGGFTLLEALAAVAITAAVLSGLATLAGQWLPQWRHGFVALQGADLIGLALDRMVEDIASAEYARLDGAAGAPLFRGEPEAVAFVRQAIGPEAGPRLEVVRIGETETPAGVEIQRAHATFAPAAVGAFRDAATLLRPPFRLLLAYAGPDGQWRARWTGEAKLPRAIRLQIRTQSGALLAATAFVLKVTAAPDVAAQPQTPAKPAAVSEDPQ